jgi:hypothetical protein
MMSGEEVPPTVKRHHVLRPTKFQKGDMAYLVRNEESVV